MEISKQRTISKQISEKSKKSSVSVEHGKGERPRVEKKTKVSIEGQKLGKRSIEIPKSQVVPTPELKKALIQAVELIKNNNPHFNIDFDNVLKVLAGRSPEDQEKFIRTLHERFSQEEGWISWGFKTLGSRVASFYSLGTEGLTTTHEYASILGEFAANMLIQARKDAVNYVVEYMPSIPSVVDEMIQSIGKKAKEAVTNVVSTPTFEKLMFLMLLPTYPHEESDEDIQKDAQEKIKDIEIFIEKTSSEISEFYSLEGGKLEILTDQMSDKFNETVIKSVSTTVSAISAFVMESVSDATQTMFSREKAKNLLIKIVLCTVLMEQLGPKEILAGVPGQESVPLVLGVRPGLLTPSQIKILVFCIMTILKGKKPAFYPTSIFLLLKGPLAFVKKGGKGYIKALVNAILTGKKDLLAISGKFLVGKLIELLVFKPVMKKSFENTLKRFCETLGLHDMQLFTENKPTFEQISSTLIEFPEALEAFNPEEFKKFIEGIKNLSPEEKKELLIQLPLQQMIKLPKLLQEILFEIILVHLPNNKLINFFGKGLETLSNMEKESLFKDIYEFSPEEKQGWRERLYPIFNSLPLETRKQLYYALEFNLVDIFMHAQLPESFKKTVGNFIEKIFQNSLKDEQKVFEQEVNMLTLDEVGELIKKFSMIKGLSLHRRNALHQVLVRRLKEEKAKKK